jgi:hypothetical protein
MRQQKSIAQSEWFSSACVKFSNLVLSNRECRVAFSRPYESESILLKLEDGMRDPERGEDDLRC